MASMMSCSIFLKNIFETHLRRERSCLGGRTQVAACESEMVKNRELERRSPSSEWISSVSRFRIRSDEGLALETLAFQSLLVGKFRELTLKKWEVPAGRISRSLPADVLWDSFVTSLGEKWMRGKRTPKDVCGEATYRAMLRGRT